MSKSEEKRNFQQFAINFQFRDKLEDNLSGAQYLERQRRNNQ